MILLCFLFLKCSTSVQFSWKRVFQSEMVILQHRSPRVFFSHEGGDSNPVLSDKCVYRRSGGGEVMDPINDAPEGTINAFLPENDQEGNGPDTFSNEIALLLSTKLAAIGEEFLLVEGEMDYRHFVNCALKHVDLLLLRFQDLTVILNSKPATEFSVRERFDGYSLLTDFAEDLVAKIALDYLLCSGDALEWEGDVDEDLRHSERYTEGWFNWMMIQVYCILEVEELNWSVLANILSDGVIEVLLKTVENGDIIFRDGRFSEDEDSFNFRRTMVIIGSLIMGIGVVILVIMAVAGCAILRLSCGVLVEKAGEKMQCSAEEDQNIELVEYFASDEKTKMEESDSKVEPQV